MLHKTLGLRAIKELDVKQGIIMGYWSSFDVIDAASERVRPGAYAKTIQETGPGSPQPRIMYLWQHETKSLLGKPAVLTEDAFGLYFEAQIAPTTLGRDVLTLYEYGVITEHSIGYDIVRSTYNRLTGVRDLEELKLYEGSAVTWGCNATTPVLGIKAAHDPEGAARRIKSLDDLLHKSDIRTEALAGELERELKALQATMLPAPAPSAGPYTIVGALDAIERALSSNTAGATGQPAEGAAMTTRKRATSRPAKPAQPAPAGTTATPKAELKARDFLTVYTTDRDAYDLIEDLDDLMEALKESILSVMIEGSGDLLSGTGDGDAPTLGTSLTQFGEAVTAWVEASRSQDCWGDIADSMEEAEDYASEWGVRRPYSYYMAAHAPEGREGKDAGEQKDGLKAGRAISTGNRKTLVAAAAGIKKAMGDMATHHKSIQALLDATDPKRSNTAAEENEEEGETESDAGDGGKAGRTPSATKDTRTLAPDRAPSGGSGTTQSFDPSALLNEARAISAGLAASLKPVGK